MTTETDRELLEWAAKAAGVNVWTDIDGNYYSEGVGVAEKPWNPLTDDGDALRMAVNLAMELIITFDYVRIVCGKANISEYFHATDDYRFIATRRAITRAAAAIGKAMK